MQTNMKKSILLFIFLCLIGDACLLAQKGRLSKGAMKSYKKECKKLKAEGWTVYCFGKAPSVEEVMMRFYLQLDSAMADNSHVQDVIVEGKGSNVNDAYDLAKHRAALRQATQEGAIVKAITKNTLSSSSGETTENVTTLRVERKINPDSPVVCLRRTLKDEGTAEIRLYYIIMYRKR